MTAQELPERVANAGEAEWVREMRAHFERTGTYRAADLLRLLGDPTAGVELKTEARDMKNALIR